MKKGLIIISVILGGFLLAVTSVALAATSATALGWIQVNQDGFGNSLNSIASLEVYDGQLYAGTWSNDYGNHAAQIWRATDGKNWYQVTPSWTVANGVVSDMQVFDSQLYVGIANDNGGEIWRSSNGSTWVRVVGGGFGDINNYAANSLAVFSDTVIVATSNITSGVEIWSSVTGDSGDWIQVNSDGFGNGATTQDIIMDVFGDYIYVGLGRTNSGMAELWRSNDGTTWNSVFTNGLGDSNNTNVSSMEEYMGYFYIGLRNVTTGGEVWRSSNGTNWTTVFTGGKGDIDNQRPYGLSNFNNNLYLTMHNASTGAEVWESSDGVNWQVIADNSWGDLGNHFADYYDKANAIFNGGLYLGTLNTITGGEVWLYLSNQIFLPLVIR